MQLSIIKSAIVFLKFFSNFEKKKIAREKQVLQNCSKKLVYSRYPKGSTAIEVSILSS